MINNFFADKLISINFSRLLLYGHKFIISATIYCSLPKNSYRDSSINMPYVRLMELKDTQNTIRCAGS